MEEKLSDQIKHTAAHILATAVLRVFPDAKVGIGPVTNSGFYYDFDLGNNTIDEDKKNLIMTEINNIIQSDLPVTQKIISREDASRLLLQIGQIYKFEMLSTIQDEEISFFSIGNEFIDLCRGPHVKSTKEVGPIIIEKITETHWNEDIRRPKMYRIYGKVFNSITELQNYIQIQNLKQKYNFKKLIINDKKNFIINIDNGLVCYSEQNSYIIKNIQKIINTTVLNKENQIELFMQPFYLNIDKLEYDLKHMFKGVILSHKFIEDNTFFCFYINTFLYESNLGNSEDVTTYKGINSSIIYYIGESKNIDLDNLIDEIYKDFEEFGINSKDINLEIHAKSLNDNLLIQLSVLLQKKFVSHTKVINPNLSVLKIRVLVDNAFEEKWCLEQIEIDLNNKLFKLSENNNSVFNPISIRKIISRDIIFRFLLSNPKRNKKQEILVNPIICVPINKKFNNEIMQIHSYLSYNGFNAKIDITSKSLKSKIKKHSEKQTKIFVFIGQKEKYSNSISLRINKENIGLISINDLIPTLKHYIEE